MRQEKSHRLFDLRLVHQNQEEEENASVFFFCFGFEEVKDLFEMKVGEADLQV